MRRRAVGQVGAPDALGAAAHRRAGALHMADEPRPRGGAHEEQEEGRAPAGAVAEDPHDYSGCV